MKAGSFGVRPCPNLTRTRSAASPWPPNEPVVAGGVRTEVIGQVAPWRSGSQHSEDAIEDTPIVHPWYAARPINRLALLLMIVHEISEAICALDHSAAFIRKMFSRQVATSLNDLQSPRDRARRMARLLIDRARDRGEHLADAA